MDGDGKRVLIILGHPRADSLSAAMAEQYRLGALASQAEVRVLALAQLAFDPLLRPDDVDAQPLEADLQAAQEAIRWARHLVFVYPIWWGAMPALLKGFIDRVFLSGFAYRYRNNSAWWDRLLAGRSARLITLMDTPPWYFRWVYRMPGHHQMKRTILEFSGIRPVRISSFGAVRQASAGRREHWLRQAFRLGRRLA
jgi:NAD(P)H dehydrogenase (quinone)